MNIDRFSLFLQSSRLLLSMTALMLTTALTACGGGSSGKKSDPAPGSSSLASSSHAASSMPANGSGVWPSVKITGNLKTLTFEWTAAEGKTTYQLQTKPVNAAPSVEWTPVGGAIEATSTSLSIDPHLYDWTNTKYSIKACNGTEDCANSEDAFPIVAMLNTIGYLKASNAETGDFFGWSLAISGDGNTLAIGAPAEDSNATGINGNQVSNTSNNSGAVYVFIKNGTGVWEQQAYIKASNTEQPNLNSARFLPNDRFGYRVALSDDGNTLAVTALLEDSPSNGIDCNDNNFEFRSAPANSNNAGNSSTMANSSNASDTSSMASSSNTGDTSNISISAADYNVGAVYVFKRSGTGANTVWKQDAYVKPLYSIQHLEVNEGMRFGEALALSGDGRTLAVGVRSDLAPISGANALFSSSMSNHSMSSQARCYEFYPSSISSSSRLSSSISSSNSSSSSNTSSSTLSTSSATSSITIPGGSFSGAVYIYIDANGDLDKGWEEEAHVKPLNSQAGDIFGSGLSLSTDGNTMAVGAIGEDSIATGVNGNQYDNSCFYIDNDLVVTDPACTNNIRNSPLDNGAAYVFSRSNRIWTQEAYLKQAAPYPFTSFGYSVSLAGDGNTLAVGAAGDASMDTGINAQPDDLNSEYLNSGAIYIFERTGTVWAQDTYIKLDLNIQGKEFGNSLSLSQDGNTLAAGSYRDASNAAGIGGDEANTSAEESGAVFVYQRVGNGWVKKNFVKAGNPDRNDRFGLNVDLSADGSTLAVGAHRESGAITSSSSSSSSSSTNNNAEAAGAVYLY